MTDPARNRLIEPGDGADARLDGPPSAPRAPCPMAFIVQLLLYLHGDNSDR